MGTLPLYYLGRLVSEEQLKVWVNTYGKWFMVSDRYIDKAKDWFNRHGSKAVFFCRLIPGVRSFISIPAGFARMNFVTYLFYSALGTGLWVTMLAYLEYLLGENYKKVEKYWDLGVYIVLVIIVVVCVGWFMKRKKRVEIT